MQPDKMPCFRGAYSAKMLKTLLLSWPVDCDCGCRFSDLFENNITEINQEEFKQLSIQSGYQVCDTWRLLTLPGENPGRNFPGPMSPRKGIILILNMAGFP